jgi:hypothetical protein
VNKTSGILDFLHGQILGHAHQKPDNFDDLVRHLKSIKEPSHINAAKTDLKYLLQLDWDNEGISDEDHANVPEHLVEFVNVAIADWTKEDVEDLLKAII